MPSTCVFEFDRPDPVYYSGEVINGRIVLNTTSEKSVREVYILFEGEAKVRWEERRTRSRNGKTEHYTEHFRANESYINSRTAVFGEGNLPPGKHVYTFTIPLPLSCPTSCVEKYGRISYEISLVLNRPFRFDNTFSQSLTVIKQLNLNLYPDMLFPLKNEDIKYFCCWPCSSGPVISVLTIPFGGYAPGQKIQYTLEVDNQSHGYDLNGLELELRQSYKFTAHYPRHKTRYHSNTLATTAKNETVLRLSKKILKGVLQLPAVPPTSKDFHGIIEVSYDIKMSVKTGDCHSDSEITIPITIGTVPLAQTASNPENAAAVMPTAPVMPPTPDSPEKPPSYDFYKPPSFEEATTGGQFVDTDKDERNRGEPFIPKYPMYSNFAGGPSAPSAPPDDTNWGSEAPLMQSQNANVTLGRPPPYRGPSTSAYTPATPYPNAESAPYPENNENSVEVQALPYPTGDFNCLIPPPLPKKTNADQNLRLGWRS